MIPRGKLREIVCALQAMPGDIAGATFSWTLKTRQLFARIRSGSAIDGGDLLELDRACEIAQGIARILHGRYLEPWFSDCRSVIACSLSGDGYCLSGRTLEDTLRQLREKRADAERGYLQAFKEDA